MGMPSKPERSQCLSGHTVHAQRLYVGRMGRVERLYLSCGRGSKRRQRGIKQAPFNGGTACEVKDKSEVKPCNTQPCNSEGCINGAWGRWSDWTGCSATCGGALRSRSRDLEQIENDCGTPAPGDDEQL